MKRRIVLLITLMFLLSHSFCGCVSKKKPGVDTTLPQVEEIEKYDTQAEKYDAQIDWGNGHIEEHSNDVQPTEASKSNISNFVESEESIVWTETIDIEDDADKDYSGDVTSCTETTDIETDVSNMGEAIVGIGNVGSGGKVEWD